MDPSRRDNYTGDPNTGVYHIGEPKTKLVYKGEDVTAVGPVAKGFARAVGHALGFFVLLTALGLVVRLAVWVWGGLL